MWKAGTASECITPSEPLWMAGYAARTEPSRGKVSDLYASALALEDPNGEKFVIASMDIIAITKQIADPVYAACGLAPDRLILAASHTHFGPEFRTDKAIFFKIPQEYSEKMPEITQELANALTRVILAAMKNLEPVKLFARQTTA